MILLLLPVGFAIAFLAIGIPFWQIPYNHVDPTHTELLPGLVMLSVITAMLVVSERIPTRWIAMVMLGCFPAVDVVAIARDTAVDPTTHNLAPFELVTFAALGAFFVLPGLLLGAAVRALTRRPHH